MSEAKRLAKVQPLERDDDAFPREQQESYATYMRNHESTWEEEGKPRRTYKTYNENDITRFIQLCVSRRLNPNAGHVVPQKRHGELRPITSIDAFRLIAQRTGLEDGQDPPEWCGTDGIWTEVWLKKEPPLAARVRVYKKGVPRPYVVPTLLSMYEKNRMNTKSMWHTAPAHMLAKCAEALSLRKAYPEELGGLYTHDEMAPATAEASSADVIPIDKQIMQHANAVADEQARHRNDSAVVAEQWIEKDLPAIAAAPALESWCHINGYALETVHRNAYGRVWTALMKKAETLAVPVATLKQWLKDARSDDQAPAVEALRVDEPPPTDRDAPEYDASTGEVLPENPGDYVMPIGKQKGLRLNDCDLSKLSSLIAFLGKKLQNGEAHNVELTKDVIANVERYIKWRLESERAKQVQLDIAQDDDFPPGYGDG